MNSEQSRFWRKVDIRSEDECWPWMGAVCDGGYGVFRRSNGNNERSHRLSVEFSTGAPPGPLHVRHACDNRICCNPKHLLKGTNYDNVQDRNRRGRTRTGVARGLANGNSVHSDEVIAAIRAQRGLEPQRVTAKRFGCSQSYVSAIQRNAARVQ